MRPKNFVILSASHSKTGNRYHVPLYFIYSIRALLLTKGLEPKSHEGVLRLFGLHFVKPGSFEAKDSHIFSKLMKYREEADYNPSYTFIRDDFIEFRSEADIVIQKIERYLKEKKYLKAAPNSIKP